MKIRLLLLLVALTTLGCGGRAVVKSENPSSAVSSPASGPPLPSQVDVKTPVTDEEYKAAVAAVGSAEVDRRNLESFQTIAQYQYNHANLSDSLKIYQKILLIPNSSSAMDQAQYMVGQIYYDKQDYLPSLAAFQTVMQKYPKSVYAAQSRQMMEFMLGYSLGLEDLKRFVENYPDSPLNCSALFQLGSHEAQAGMQSQAQEHLNAFVQKCPQHASAAAAQLLLQSLQNQQEGKSWKIGVLVPQTGRFKGFGQSVLNGITLAMEQANQSGGTRKPMSVLVRDTGSDGLKAVTVLQELVKDDSLDAILGPVAPSDIQAVCSLANERRITVLCPASSRDGLSSMGPYIFANGMTNEMQGRAIARYAVEHLGFHRFGILAPDDGYGQTLSDAFKKTVESMGATVVGSETYIPNSTDFKKQLLALGGQDPGSSKENDRENNRRFDELKYAIKKETVKIILKAKEVSGASAAVSTAAPALAFVPLAEGLTNTLCASIAPGINQAVQEAFQDQQDYTLRAADLVQQGLTRLPVEFRGTTVPASAEVWSDIAQDIQASLLVTGRIVQINPPGEDASHPTWDFVLTFEAFQMDPKKNTLVKIYQGRIPYSFFKPASMNRGNLTYQALYLPAHSVEIPLLVSQAHFYDLSPVFLGGHLWENDSVRQEGGKDVEGSYFVSGFYVDSQQGMAKKFADDYLKRFAKRPDLLAAQSYDAAKLLLKATETAAGRDDIHTNLLAIKDFDGASGKTTFGGHGEADKVVPILKIQDGKFQQVQ